MSGLVFTYQVPTYHPHGSIIKILVVKYIHTCIYTHILKCVFHQENHKLLSVTGINFGKNGTLCQCVEDILEYKTPALAATVA